MCCSGKKENSKNGKLTKTIFYFCWADAYGKCKILLAEKAVNQGDDERMQVPCLLRLVGKTRVEEGYLKKAPKTKTPEVKATKLGGQNPQDKISQTLP